MIWKSIAWEEIPPQIHIYNKLGIFLLKKKMLDSTFQQFSVCNCEEQGGEQHNQWNSGISI